jgi:hypothetical protein
MESWFAAPWMVRRSVDEGGTFKFSTAVRVDEVYADPDAITDCLDHTAYEGTRLQRAPNAVEVRDTAIWMHAIPGHDIQRIDLP